MIEDMNARKLCAGTQRGHIRSCKRFAALLKRSPETATFEDMRRFQLHLTRREQVQQYDGQSYSMTSSARTSSNGGIASPSGCAVFRLITSSNLVGCCTGVSAGVSPLRTRASWRAMP